MKADVGLIVGVECQGPKPYGLTWQQFEMRSGTTKDGYPYMCPRCQNGLRFSKNWLGKTSRTKCNSCGFSMFITVGIERVICELP